MKTGGAGDDAGGIGAQGRSHPIAPDCDTLRSRLPVLGTGDTMHALVVGGGSISTTAPPGLLSHRLDDQEWLRREVSQARIIIGADAGAGHLWACGARPDLVVGDLDSLDQATINALEAAGVPFARHPTVKDATDLELAIREAVDRGATSLLIAGATGSPSAGGERLDHLFGNVGLLGHPMVRGLGTRLISPTHEICLITGPDTVRVIGRPMDLVSLVPLTDHVDGITTTGLAYPLAGERLSWGTSRGISNELRQTMGMVTATAGRLLVIHQRRHRGEGGVAPTRA